MSLNASIKQAQSKYGIFDPSGSTIIVGNEVDAGKALADLLGVDKKQAISLNPYSDNGISRVGALPESDSSRDGFERIGSILITEQSAYTNVINAYGAYVLAQNGGYTTSGLNTANTEMPTTSVTTGEVSYTVAQSALDGAKFLTDMAQRVQGFSNLGEVVVYERDGQKYYDYTRHSYDIKTDAFHSYEPIQAGDDYKKFMNGLYGWSK